MIYDVTNPNARLFTNLKTGECSEGLLLFLPQSPTKRSLVIVSSEA
jgi:hypothetical protein